MSLSELTPYLIYSELYHLGLEVSILDIDEYLFISNDFLNVYEYVEKQYQKIRKIKENI